MKNIFNDRITYLANNIVELNDKFYQLEAAVWEYSDDSQDGDTMSVIATESICLSMHAPGDYMAQSNDRYSMSAIDFGIDELFQNADVVREIFMEEKPYVSKNEKIEEGTWLYGQGPLVASIKGSEIKSISNITLKIGE